MNSTMLAGLVKIIAVILVVCGAAGMLLSAVFLFSSRMADITGAGFCFVAGAVMLGSGTISLAVICTRPDPQR